MKDISSIYLFLFIHLKYWMHLTTLAIRGANYELIFFFSQNYNKVNDN